MTNQFEKAFIGCIIGTAVGDALGLSFEGMSRRRIAKWNTNLSTPCFCGQKGMVSDDTEHTIMLGESLLLSNTISAFLSTFAWRLRFWLLRLPAGIGFATLRAIGKLWLGVSPQKSGVFSAGNGAAMRIALLGIYYGDQEDFIARVKSCTAITHSDPKAFLGSLAIAIAAYQSFSEATPPTPKSFFTTLYQYQEVMENQEFQKILNRIEQSLEKKESLQIFLNSIHCENGISGYIYHTFPAVLHCWLQNPENYEEAITEIILAGGDTDTTAAILGAIIGARVGKDRIPLCWQKNICEYPKNITYMENLAIALAKKKQGLPFSFKPRTMFLRTLLRNVVFLIIVLFHGFRRLFPPY